MGQGMMIIHRRKFLTAHYMIAHLIAFLRKLKSISMQSKSITTKIKINENEPSYQIKINSFDNKSGPWRITSITIARNEAGDLILEIDWKIPATAYNNIFSTKTPSVDDDQ